MKKSGLFSLIFILSMTAFGAESKELNMQEGKVYLLNFDEKIENINSDENTIDAQIMHTIYGDNEQIILSIKNSDKSFLQIKTANGMYNYEVKNNSKSSTELIEIDFPPIENLDVDIYTGD